MDPGEKTKFLELFWVLNKLLKFDSSSAGETSSQLIV